MKSFSQIDQENEGKYIKLLSVVSKLSGLFSESTIPYINYRLAENIFCNSFNAINLSRSDTAFDAKIDNLGIGLKTFTCIGGSSLEKVAEFNSLASKLKSMREMDLAIELSNYRNDRINMAKRLYNIEDSLYHIVARRKNELLLFETDYNCINIDELKSVKSTKTGIQFNDDKNSYSFNYSKSTLYRKFLIPFDAYSFPIEIIDNPYDILLSIFKEKVESDLRYKLIAGENYVILPLYGIKENEKFVFEKSGLNQWNASGRTRDPGELYIPIPIEIHKRFPDFFPERDLNFDLEIPTKENFSAKVCQENSKALMTNPNKALSDWLLRRILKLEEGEIATIEKLNLLGFDSVIIYKDKPNKFRIDISKIDSYEEFMDKS